jgi:hypothetical protein
MLLLRTSDSLIDLVEVSPEAIPALRQIAEKLSPPVIVSLIRTFTPGPAARGGLRPQLPLEISVVEAGQTLRTPRSSEPILQHPQASMSTPTPIQRVPAATPAPRPAAPTPPIAPVVPERTAAPTTPATTRPVSVGSAADVPASAPVAGPPTTPLDGAILFDEAARRWNDILAACVDKSRSVQAILRDARPVSADSEGLVLGFAYEFHREKIADLKNRTVVEDALAQVLGQRVRIRCVVSTGRDLAAPSDPAQAALDDPLVRAAVAMGARVRAVTEDRAEEKQR